MGEAVGVFPSLPGDDGASAQNRVQPLARFRITYNAHGLCVRRLQSRFLLRRCALFRVADNARRGAGAGGVTARVCGGQASPGRYPRRD